MASDPVSAAQPVRYHSAAIALHWLLAALLGFQFALGLRLGTIAAGGAKYTAFQFHKSIGITILVLSLARLALRLTLRRPAEVGEGVQRLAARLVHRAFYAVMILAPLSGWIIVSTAKLKVPTVLFGLMPWPRLPLPAAVNQPAALAHTVLGWSLPALIALHVAAVLYHLRLRDAVPGRMVPAALPISVALVSGAGLLALSGWLGLGGPIPDLWSHQPAAAPASIEAPPIPTPPAPSPSSAAPVPTAAALDAAQALSCDWTVQPGSRLGFTAQYGGEPVNGSFRKWQARIKFCADDLPHSSIAATVNLASADTRDPSRDEALHGASFFDVANFAQARFSATGFNQLAPGRYAANGTLSLHGVSRPVRLVFNLKLAGDTAAAQGSTTLSRLAFKVGSDEWAATDQIADAVTVQFTIRARRAN